jgi:hypothetical protein
LDLLTGVGASRVVEEDAGWGLGAWTANFGGDAGFKVAVGQASSMIIDLICFGGVGLTSCCSRVKTALSKEVGVNGSWVSLAVSSSSSSTVSHSCPDSS